MGLNYRSLLEHFEREPQKAVAFVESAFKKKDIKPNEVDLGALFVEAFGWPAFVACRAKKTLARDVMEAAGGAVGTQFFQNISGQLVITATMEAWEAPEYTFTKLIPTISTPFQREKIPGISAIGDEALVVLEGDPYPLAGVVEDWIETPPTKKRGLIVPVTREAIFFDRTGLLLDRCRKVGESLGYNREIRAIDCIVDENAPAISAALGGHRYFWKGANIGATYANNAGTHTFDNLSAATEMLDYTDFENCELLLSRMVDPENGLTTGMYRAAAKYLICTTQLVHTAKQILNATEVRVHITGYPVTGNPSERASANTLQTYEILSTPLLETRMATDTTWFLGNPAKAFRYMENFPPSVKEAPSNSHDEFHRDIVQQFRADEMGAYATFDPRYMIQATVA